MDDTDMKMVVTQGEDDCRKAELGSGEQIESLEKMLAESQEKFLFFKNVMGDLLLDIEEFLSEVGGYLEASLTSLNDFSNQSKATIYLNLANSLVSMMYSYLEDHEPDEVIDKMLKKIKPEGMFLE